ncbi:MAG: hypothetical protein Q8O81_12060 [Giesbergeria sp.]|nr:hypothetical protein [Giesbergeria sp.]
MNPETARALLLRRGIGLASNDSLLTFVLLNDVVLKGVLNPLFAADTKELQAILREKGIRISDDDPIFALLALNGIVLNHSIDKVRRAQAKIGSELRSTIHLKALIATALVLGFGVGLFFGLNHIETSLVFSAAIGCVLGIALGFLGCVLISPISNK